MTTTGKCPKCEEQITETIASKVPLNNNGKSIKGGMYLCPHCSSVLGVQFDPFAQASMTAAQIPRQEN
ncbi:MAG: hypothetical protein IPG66_12620 [Hydrogenophilales bacterium]|nr:hypothetical protein [Hydrogenophilales bacterium]